jgi:hypothetical protein
VFGPIFRAKAITYTVSSMWFIVILFQYYLAYPFLLRLLNRVGPWAFAAIGLGVSWFLQWWYADWLVWELGAEYAAKTPNLVAPFRCGEFFLGMSLGWLLAHRRDAVNAWVSSPFDIAGLFVMAALLQWAAVSITFDSTVVGSVTVPMSALALAIFASLLLFKTPGRLEASALARVLVGLGLVSFTALIVNDNMRYLASFLRTEVDTPSVVWWFFLVVLYIPGATVLVAWPMARIFGLLPDQKKPAAAAPAASAQAPTGPTPDLQAANAAGN